MDALTEAIAAAICERRFRAATGRHRLPFAEMPDHVRAEYLDDARVVLEAIGKTAPVLGKVLRLRETGFVYAVGALSTFRDDEGAPKAEVILTELRAWNERRRRAGLQEWPVPDDY